MSTAIEYSTRNDAVVKAGRMMLQKHEAEVAARAQLQRVEANGFAAYTAVHQNAQRALDQAGLALDAALLDQSDTLRQVHALEFGCELVRMTELQPNDLRLEA